MELIRSPAALYPAVALGEIGCPPGGVAGYIANYATKAAECVGTLDRRINPLDNLDAYNLRDHAKRLITECLRLGAIADLADLRLTHWAHMLGFRGHFSTRSRHYGPTLCDLRAAREHFVHTKEVTRGRLPFDDDTVLVITEWQYAGKGHSAGDLLLIAALTSNRPGAAHER
ncbi:hypothetical protein HTZ77_37130 [Nonomuraea sp. SMC257]|uniref:Uncharacterized protein n=1 Tax=Nonomuraea montanisoli TaxID=2741721 RepID=A0A7Y6IEZ4_9ACTN|nr:replication initiator [Nonomuraea montanisoli]NUW36988.1 hypothetical protein [Nonomuraea montanisoli]